jgi:hypothetical protein
MKTGQTRRRLAGAALAAALVAAAGWAAFFIGTRNRLPDLAAKALAEATRATLYSLEPDSLPPSGARAAATETNGIHRSADTNILEGYWVLGSTELTNDAARAATRAFQNAIAESRGPVARCFDPHHGLRLSADGHVYDYLLCYHCGQMQVYEDGKFTSMVGVTGSPEALNAMLKAARVPLSAVYNPVEAADEKNRP